MFGAVWSVIETIFRMVLYVSLASMAIGAHRVDKQRGAAAAPTRSNQRLRA